MPVNSHLGSWLSDFVHEAAGYIVGNGNEPGTPMSRAGQISDDDLARELIAATAAQPPQGVTTKQAMVLGGGALMLWLAMRRR